MLEPIYFQAAEGRYKDFHDFSSAIAINQAIQQRNTQWAAEQTIFMTTVRPLLAFFEGFVYAITPILAFLILLGKTGMTLAVKYAQVIIWIQLWLPVLSIINLFIHSAAAGELNSNTSIGAIDSMYALNETSQILQTWVSTGGMLAAATPVISLFIVTGSTYALTGLANRLNGADHFNEKQVTPDASQVGALLNVGAANSFDINKGVSAAGSDQFVGNAKIAQAASANKESAKARQEQAQTSFDSTLSNTFSKNASMSDTTKQLHNMGRIFEAADSTAWNKTVGQAKEFCETAGIDQKHAETVASALTLQATGALSASATAGILSGLKKDSGGTEVVEHVGASIPPLSSIDGKSPVKKEVSGEVNGAVIGKTDNTDLDQKSKDYSNNTAFKKGINISEQDASTFKNALSENFSQGKEHVETLGFSEADAQQLSQSAKAVETATDSYKDAETWATTTQASKDINLGTAAYQVSKNQNASAIVNDEYNKLVQKNPEIAQDVLDDKHLYESQRFNYSEDQADMLAKMNAVMANASAENPNGYHNIMNAISMATGGASYTKPSEVNAASNQHLAKNAPDPDEVRKQVTSGVDPNLEKPEGFSESVEGAVLEPLSSESLPTAPNTAITGEHDANVTKNKDQAKQDDVNTSAGKVRDLENRIINDTPTISVGAGIWGAVDNLGGLNNRSNDETAASVQGMGAGMAAAGDYLSTSINDLKNMTPEERQEHLNDLQAATQEDGMFKTFGKATLGLAAGIFYEPFSDDANLATEGMSLHEKGEFYSGALAGSASQGGEAYQAFIEQHGQDVARVATQLAMDNYNLTPEQAAVYETQFSSNLADAAGVSFMDIGEEAKAIEALRLSYAERDQDGNVLYDDDGKPLLSEHNEQLTEAIVDQLQHAAYGGDHAGSYLTDISEYNLARQSVVDN